MQKLLIEISLPAAGIKQDFRVPASMQAGVLARLAAEIFSAGETGQYRPMARPALILDGSQSCLDPEIRLLDAGLKNGSCLFLI